MTMQGDIWLFLVNKIADCLAACMHYRRMTIAVAGSQVELRIERGRMKQEYPEIKIIVIAQLL